MKLDLPALHAARAREAVLRTGQLMVCMGLAVYGAGYAARALVAAGAAAFDLLR